MLTFQGTLPSILKHSQNSMPPNVFFSSYTPYLGDFTHSQISSSLVSPKPLSPTFLVV